MSVRTAKNRVRAQVETKVEPLNDLRQVIDCMWQTIDAVKLAGLDKNDLKRHEITVNSAKVITTAAKVLLRNSPNRRGAIVESAN